MKTAILLIITFVSINCLAGTDSVTVKMISPEQAIGIMGINFRNHQREFSNGIKSLATGTVLGIAGALMKDSKDPNHTLKTAMITGSGIFVLIGSILVIDSNKWLNANGKIHLSPDGLIIEIR